MKKNPSIRQKTKVDIQAMKEVQYAAQKAMAGVIAYLTRSEVPTAEGAHEIIDILLEECDCVSPEGHIVSGGRHSAVPHEIGSGVLHARQPIVIDIYPQSRKTGLFADMSRTVCIESAPTELQKMYDTVLAAQELAIEMIAPGVSCVQMQLAVEKLFVDAGYRTFGKGKEFAFSEGFVHSLGHGVGYNIHESPHFGRNSTDILQVGDVITIEPGLYYKNIGGVRLEDMLLVTATGSESFTIFPKHLVI